MKTHKTIITEYSRTACDDHDRALNVLLEKNFEILETKIITSDYGVLKYLITTLIKG